VLYYIATKDPPKLKGGSKWS
jgi:serine/threonine protein kinase